ncbi:YgdI/YgdR family lipoprotein [Cronobacter sakazakii]|nr:YgdI/YgdR family lipoprotein [Cronobacter sakazakii]ELQ6176150.1 YgdI/YgdR family lipoprotein [Cronobacter sakazakii]ELQ6188737.1 YgdI/YgdR family lipoprotein [Cronobacter sakazakii]
MRSKLLITSIFAAATLFTVAGCSSNQAVKTTDGKTVVTDGKPEVDSDTGLVSYKNAQTGQTGQTEQINRDQVKSMSELDN